MSFTYAAVDESVDPDDAATWQEHINNWPAIRAYKAHTYELVARADLMLDVGCGPGTDAAHLGRGRVVGLDPSSVMCRRAAERAVTVCRCDAAALPFAEDAFDACRADRVIQHLDDPTTAIRELVRVTRRGGRVVVTDPDQETLTVHVPGIPKPFIDRVKQLRRDVGYRHGRLVTALPELFGSLGLTDVALTAFPLVLTDPDDAFGLRSRPRLWRDRDIGTWDDDELAGWEQALGGGGRPGFVYALIYFVVAGTKA